MKALRFVRYAWCVAVVVAYLALWLTSEHGGGIFFQSGIGEIWLIALVWLAGIGLINLAYSKARQGKPKQ